ncbi:MAG: iron-containing alcohol dehydrogenase [Candidatus Cloacimonetes bacterium]|nr:iron-containing alcohol dehydrogenase [Candidatus Cloacimonadota bacterium]
MESFSFYNPTKVQFGVGMIRKLGSEMMNAGVKHCLLIAGRGSIKQNGVYNQVMESLSGCSISVSEVWGVQANPTLNKVKEIISFAKEKQVDAILAVGGGSVIDTAKSVAAGVYLNDVWNAFTDVEKITQALPIFTVLTISASGSELNSNAVITNTDKLQKWSFTSQHVFPKVTFIDPTVQCSLPFKLTANGAIDAMSHIMEYYFSNNKALSTLCINDALLKNIVKMTDILQHNPSDLVARSNLAWSASLALSGITGIGMRGGDWACHQIEHAISALHPDIAHGEGLGVIFPAWVEYMSEKNPSLFLRWAKNVWGEDKVALGVRRARDKIDSWGMATSLRDLGIKENELSEIAKLIMHDSEVGGISKFRSHDIEALLMLAY